MGTYPLFYQKPRKPLFFPLNMDTIRYIITRSININKNCLLRKGKQNSAEPKLQVPGAKRKEALICSYLL
jgi:hypothetical protein